ncbi:hypothetical protein OSL73_24285, partial [Escherichia coli]|nr:hypothetical protein [Escherichia coli]
GAIHVISAFSTMHSLVIGQIRTDEKSNEITAIPELLNMLDINGFAPIFPDICYHLTHYKPAAADIPV